MPKHKYTAQYEVKGVVETPFLVVINDDEFHTRRPDEQAEILRKELYLRDFQTARIDGIEKVDGE